MSVKCPGAEPEMPEAKSDKQTISENNRQIQPIATIGSSGLGVALTHFHVGIGKGISKIAP
jgi:hypothetical protein